MGITDLVVQTGNLLLPLVSLGIINGVVRFGLDRSVRKSDVFSTGILSIVAGFIILLLFSPLINQIRYVSDYTFLMYLFVFMSSMRSLCSQFVKARNLVRLYAFDGILSTATTILFNILFLVGFRWGAMGYILRHYLFRYIVGSLSIYYSKTKTDTFVLKEWTDYKPCHARIFFAIDSKHSVLVDHHHVRSVYCGLYGGQRCQRLWGGL